MEIRGENYHIIYNPTQATITCQGSLRQRGPEEYTPVTQLLDHVVQQKSDVVTLNLQPLKFLNSPGINVLAQFIIKLRNQQASRLVIQGTQVYPWQYKSLRNLQRLMPDSTLEFE